MPIVWVKTKWWYWCARTQARRENFRSAFSYIQRVLDFRPENVHMLCYAGYCLHEQGQYEEATKLYDRALQIKPDCAYAHAQLGRILLHMQKPKEALES